MLYGEQSISQPTQDISVAQLRVETMPQPTSTISPSHLDFLSPYIRYHVGRCCKGGLSVELGIRSCNPQREPSSVNCPHIMSSTTVACDDQCHQLAIFLASPSLLASPLLPCCCCPSSSSSSSSLSSCRHHQVPACLASSLLPTLPAFANLCHKFAPP